MNKMRNELGRNFGEYTYEKDDMDMLVQVLGFAIQNVDEDKFDQEMQWAWSLLHDGTDPDDVAIEMIAVMNLAEISGDVERGATHPDSEYDVCDHGNYYCAYTIDNYFSYPESVRK